MSWAFCRLLCFSWLETATECQINLALIRTALYVQMYLCLVATSPLLSCSPSALLYFLSLPPPLLPFPMRHFPPLIKPTTWFPPTCSVQKKRQSLFLLLFLCLLKKQKRVDLHPTHYDSDKEEVPHRNHFIHCGAWLEVKSLCKPWLLISIEPAA